jgi:ABC-type cobalamin/Fe3+-siderophores transport system ATPase subunit
MLELRDVAYSYEGTEAVRGVTLQLQPAQLVALTGANGSGKSTLLKLMARVATPRSGEIVFEGKRLRDWAPREYAKRVGYLPQEPDPTFPMRALDLVVTGRAPFLSRFAWESSEDYATAERALAMCDAAHLAQRYLDEMSGGERKRVFLARVLAGAPKLILLDEPLAALDIAHVQQVSALLRDIVGRTGCTVVFASHDLNWAAAYSDRMLVLREGTLARDATPSAVMEPAAMRELFGFEAYAVEAGGRRWLVPRT